MRVADPTKRNTYLRKGKLAICAFLAELPKSEHDVTSFTLDIPFATERLMSFSVSGIFREPENQGGQAGQIIRHFNRVFVVVPHGQGFCIVNDMLYITIPTHRQKKVKKCMRNFGFRIFIGNHLTPDNKSVYLTFALLHFNRTGEYHKPKLQIHRKQVLITSWIQ